MKNGTFVAGTQIFFAVLPNNDMLILNGNHTLEAVAISKNPVPLTLTYHPVRDVDEAGLLYAQFDIHRSRNWNDALKGMGFVENMPEVWVQRAGAALGMVMSRFVNPDRALIQSRHLRGRLLEKYDTPIRMLMASVTKSDTEAFKFFRRKAIMAVALETTRYQPNTAIDFWTAFIADDGLKLGDPRKTLLNYCRNNTAGNGINDSIVQSKCAALAWNAFFGGTELKQMRPNQLLAFRLDGTPWTKEDYDPLAELSTASSKPSVGVDATIPASFTSGIGTDKMGEHPIIQFAV